jgi:hypothetical protein
MSEKQFDILDQHFRNAAEQYQPAFSEAAWNKMEAKLDEENRRKKPAGWYWWLSDGLIIATMLFMVFSLHNNNKEQVNAAKESQLKNEQQKAAGDKISVITNPAPTAADENKTATTIPASNGENKTATPSNAVIKISNARSLKRVPPYGDDALNAISKAGVRGKKVGSENLLNDGSLLAAGSNGADEKEKANSNSIKGQNNSFKDANDLPASEKAKTNAASNTDTRPVNTDALPVNKKQELAPPKEPASKSSRFFLYIGGGPEWSFVPGNSMGPVTATFGGGVGYSINKKWSIQAGLFSTKKNYGADGSDYKARPGSYYYNLTINHVEAYCNVIEIPVTVNYALLQHKRSTLFISAGVSSLLMSKETYHYDYERWNGTPAYAAYTYKTNNLHPAAGAMLSAGYKIKLLDDFSFVASPYVKIPIYGVGEGKIKLGSVGMLVGLHYQIPSLRKE